jgi:hypothetical protein
MEMDWEKKYDGVGEFSQGRAWVKLNGKYGYVNLMGEAITPLKYDGVGQFGNSVAIVFLNGKFSFVDLQGNEVVPLKYDDLTNFYNGKAMIRIGKIWGEIDMNGKEYFSTAARAKLRKDKAQRLLNHLNEKEGFVDNEFGE